jgi:preprotein translocase subunit SecE
MVTKKTPKRDIGVIGFLQQVQEEMRHVTWPKKDEAINKSLMVIAISAIVGVYLGALDYLFVQLMGFLVQ